MDGVGGKAKSLVRTAVMSKKSDRTVVQSSKDFSDVARQLMKQTTVIHISQEEIDNYVKDIVSWTDAAAVPGIQKMHMAASSLGGETVEIYEHSLADHAILTVGLQQESHDTAPVSVMDEATAAINNLAVGDWCVVMYDNEQFAGEVTNIASGEYEVSVMHRCGKYFRWPSSADKIYYPLSAILRKINGPEMVTKMGPRILSEFADFK